MSELYKKFVAINDELNTILFERDDLIEGITLAILAKTNILALGPAGTAKSMAVQQWAKRIQGAEYFDILINRYTTPEEILGPVSFEGLKKGIHERIVDQMLPTSHLAFLDEVFKGNSGVLNAMLRLANERTFKNGKVTTKVPLYTMIGASNEIPDEDDGLEAFYDRFLLKFHVDYIQETSNFAQMLITNEDPQAVSTITQEEIVQAQHEILQIRLPEEFISKTVELAGYLKSKGMMASDRTYKKAMPIVKAKAWLSGKQEAEEEDLEILRHVIWHDPDDRRKAEQYVLETINPEKHRMIEQYLECKRLTDELEQYNDTPKEKATRSVEVMSKITVAKENIKKLQKGLEKVGRDTKDASIYIGKLSRLATKISMQATGMQFVMTNSIEDDFDDLLNPRSNQKKSNK